MMKSFLGIQRRQSSSSTASEQPQQPHAPQSTHAANIRSTILSLNGDPRIPPLGLPRHSTSPFPIEQTVNRVAPLDITGRNHDIPTYDEALGLTPSSPDAEAGPSNWRQRRESVVSVRTEGNRLVRDHFSPDPPRINEIVWKESDGDDDSLLSRIQRSTTSLNLGSTSQVDLSSVRPSRGVSPMPPAAAPGSRPLTPPPDFDFDSEFPPIPERPAFEPPNYSAHLGNDETRLISTVHLEHNHPAAATFSAMSAAAIAPRPETAPREEREQTTGGKKLKLILTKSGERLHGDLTGMVYIRVGREGVIEGRIEVGKVDHVTGLDVAIMGIVNTSYYVRGQYTLIDTLPLARRELQLYPSLQASEAIDTQSAEAPVSLNPQAANALSPEQATGGVITPNSESAESVTIVPPKVVTVGKDTFLAPNQTFQFSMKMPGHHFRDGNVALPPSTQILQVGMQASIEYVLRVKLMRKGWRPNETIGMPIIYDPRAYVSPRRLRALSTDDALNPGWRTIRLNGGKPTHPPEGEVQANQGVLVNLLIPSPPIWFIPWHDAPPPIPFHLHFHSRLPLPLATFSDVRESKFIVRFVRVASMRIGTERDIRRMEIPSKVEIWQEGGERVVLGEELNGVPPLKTERRRSFTERRYSLLRRRSSNASPGTSPADAESPLARVLSNAPAEPTIVEDEPAQSPTSPMRAPLSLDATDVHLFGQLTIESSIVGPAISRTLLQSFQTPEVGVSYVIEIGLQPRGGAVKEAFTHIWGGGLIEVVRGHRE